MRRLLVLVVITIMGIVPLAGAEALAQTEQFGGFTVNRMADTSWEGVSRPEPLEQAPPDNRGIAAIEVEERFQGYQVFFAEEFAAVPAIASTEFMTVIVEDGYFALDLRDLEGFRRGRGNFIVHPMQGHEIQYMEFTGQRDDGYYVLIDEFVEDETGRCTSMCAVPLERIVQVQPGDKVVAPDGGVCVWCLLNKNEGELNDFGLLLADPVLARGADPDSFSWLASWRRITGNAAHESATSAMAWAFNPPPGCKRGPS